MNLVCLRHPQYRGKDSPVLSCKCCCSIYVAKIRTDNERASAEGRPNTKYMPRKAKVAYYAKGLR